MLSWHYIDSKHFVDVLNMISQTPLSQQAYTRLRLRRRGSACRSVKKPFCPRYEGIKKVLAEGRAVPPGKRATAQALLLTFLAGEK